MRPPVRIEHERENMSTQRRTSSFAAVYGVENAANTENTGGNQTNETWFCGNQSRLKFQLVPLRKKYVLSNYRVAESLH
jgi:hypothetical protein